MATIYYTGDSEFDERSYQAYLQDLEEQRLMELHADKETSNYQEEYGYAGDVFQDDFEIRHVDCFDDNYYYQDDIPCEYNGWSRSEILEIFGGDPSLTWNLD